MSGQAIGNRIKKLEDSEVIKSYSLMVDESKLGLTYTAFIIISMISNNHEAFKKKLLKHIVFQGAAVSY